MKQTENTNQMASETPEVSRYGYEHPLGIASLIRSAAEATQYWTDDELEAFAHAWNTTRVCFKAMKGAN